MKFGTYISFIMLFSVYEICLIEFKYGFRYNIIKSHQNILSVKKYKDKQYNGWLILIKMYIHINY